MANQLFLQGLALLAVAAISLVISDAVEPGFIKAIGALVGTVAGMAGIWFVIGASKD